jgi:dTDP-4-dehydrorhamnose 3,5-epimerase
MIVTQTPIEGLLVLEPKVFFDERGYFYESFNQTAFNAAVGTQEYQFVQDNHSHSKAGVLRGLHYQLPPFAQGKLVRVVAGRVWDVAVDIRKTSATFGQWFGLELSAANKKLFWIPPGFAHGFIALEDNTAFLYKTTALYDKASEGAIVWNDTDLAITWPQLTTVLVNEKDMQANSLKTAKHFEL